MKNLLNHNWLLFWIMLILFSGNVAKVMATQYDVIITGAGLTIKSPSSINFSAVDFSFTSHANSISFSALDSPNYIEVKDANGGSGFTLSMIVNDLTCTSANGENSNCYQNMAKIDLENLSLNSNNGKTLITNSSPDANQTFNSDSATNFLTLENNAGDGTTTAFVDGNDDGVSEPLTLLSSNGAGTGIWRINPKLTINIPGNTKAGTYTGTITISAS